MSQYVRKQRIFPVAVRGVRGITDATGLSIRQCNDLIRDGLPTIRVGSRNIFLIDDVVAHLRQHYTARPKS